MEKWLIQGLVKAMLNNLALSSNFNGLLLFWKGPFFLLFLARSHFTRKEWNKS